MKKIQETLILGLLWLTAFPTIQGEEPPQKENLQDVPILTQQLGSNAYAVREKAQQALIQYGPRILETLADAEKEASDLEILSRLKQIQKQIRLGVWRTDLDKAITVARHESKPLLIMSTIGDIGGYT